MHAGALVGAVLTPHDGEDAQFGVAGLAAEERDDFLVFRGVSWCWAIRSGVMVIVETVG